MQNSGTFSFNEFPTGGVGGPRGIVVGMLGFRFHCFLGQQSYLLSLHPGVLECTNEIAVPKINPGVVLTSYPWEKNAILSVPNHATRTRMSSSHVSPSSLFVTLSTGYYNTWSLSPNGIYPRHTRKSWQGLLISHWFL